jgi:hypothetical protein
LRNSFFTRKSSGSHQAKRRKEEKLKQMALIDARLKAQMAHAALAVATHVGDPHVAQRRHDAPREPSRLELLVEQLPPPPPYPLAGYALPNLGPLFPEA